MNRKMSKRQRDIKSKLMAAICMLLVSSIMMVSTTYAWFTLSTAPEVTGINTAVGANGNLEMALMPDDGVTVGTTTNFGITSSAQDGTKAQNEKNETWGNLVDLATYETNFYGLDKVTLYPSALNATVDANNNPTLLSTSSILLTPGYGADGRVKELLQNTVTGTYESATSSFPVGDAYGVRAIGTASGLTDRQLAYRNSRAQANTYMALATTTASTSLNRNGASLANIVMAYAADPNATFDDADVAKLLGILTDLLGAYDANTGYTPAADGTLEYIAEAYRQYIIAAGASQASVTAGMDDTAFNTFQNAVVGAADLTEVMALFAQGGTYATVSLPDEIKTPIAKLQTSIANAKAAHAALLQLNGNSYSWNDLSTALNNLVVRENMLINGYPSNAFRENMSNIINSVAGQGLTVTMKTNAGVYADVADHCGNYSASIVIEEVSYGNLTLTDMNARMNTQTTVSPVYLSAAGTKVESLKSPEGTDSQVMPITDFYGYVVDLAFRTNAAESNLKLQREGTSRIYGEDGSEETMGNGSTMTFKSTTTGFSLDQMTELMRAIRIVFFDPTNGNAVYATAKLDVNPGQYTVVGGDTITAKMYLYENLEAGQVRYVQENYAENSGKTYYTRTVVDNYKEISDAEAATAEAGTLYTKAADSDTYTAATYDAGAATTYYVKDGTKDQYNLKSDEEAKAATEPLYVIQTTVAGENVKSDDVITALTQNVAKAVSVLVYLDGENVGNEDVAATAASSMTGTMNLQFSSSAPLVPMNYTPLMNQDGTRALKNITVTGDARATGRFKDSTATVTLVPNDGKAITAATATIGGAAANATYDITTGVLTITSDALTADAEIVITVTTEDAPASGG